MEFLREIVTSEITVAVVIGAILCTPAAIGYRNWRRNRRRCLSWLLKDHFAPMPLDRLTVTQRKFSAHIRAELQRAMSNFTKGVTIRAFTGVTSSDCSMDGLDIHSLMDEHLSREMRAVPPQYEDIDIGEDEPVRALMCGLWLLERDGVKFAVFCSPTADFEGCGIVQRVRFQVAAPEDEAGDQLSKDFFQYLESLVKDASCYRGKVLSLEQSDSYSGQGSGVTVHRLGKVAREEVILPKKTLALLDRNVVDFVRRRRELGEFRMATKKGILFYGPPGTGKTHTIRYLAGSLEGHTTLLISAEQVGSLGDYLTLARLLQPSLVVIEDVDLIARERGRMQDPGAEVLLNKLLNEMDGLREDCEILFILTTNRPEELEAALASRPGRIDQAIEFPLPDAEGREKLVRLYSHGMAVPDDVVGEIVRRTEKVSASFIKELMRRSAQFHLERNGTRTLALQDVENALDEMVFSGGSLNLKLLGAEGWRSGEGDELKVDS